MKERSFLEKLGGALSGFGGAFNDPNYIFKLEEQGRLKRKAMQEEQMSLQQAEERKQLAKILSGQSIPAFARPGGAEPQAPEDIRSAQMRQLGALGTPEALNVLRDISPLSRPKQKASSIERIADEVQRADPRVDRITALSIARSGLGQGMTLQDGKLVPLGGAAEAREALARAKESGAQEAKLEFEPQRKKAVQEEEIKIQLREAFPALESAYQGRVAKSDLVLEKIKDVLPRVSIYTSGLLGAPLSMIAGTEAADLRADIDTILANVGFDELQQMREASPTGGALGQVSEREIDFLQSTIANLRNSQTPAQLRKNLGILEDYLIKSRKTLNRAFERDRKRSGVEPFLGGVQPIPTPSSGALSTRSTEELLKRLEQLEGNE